MLRLLDLRPHAILVRRFAKQRLEYPNEMKTREIGSPGDRADRKGLLLPVP